MRWVVILIALSFQGCHRFQSFEDGTPPVEDDSLNWSAIYPYRTGWAEDTDNHHHWGYLRDSSVISIRSRERYDSILDAYLLALDSLRQSNDTAGIELLTGRLHDLSSMRYVARDDQGGRVLEFRYLYNVENVHDEESGFTVLIALPWGFIPEEGINYVVDSNDIQVEAWGWGAWIGEYRMKDLSGYVRFLALGEDQLTIIAEITALPDYQEGILRNGDRKERTILAGRVTFVRKGQE